MSQQVRLAIAGVGLIGRRHIASIARCKNIELSAIVDPDESIQINAGCENVPWYRSLSDMFAQDKPDGVILATPNQTHVENGLECIAEKCPTLIEKPLATTADEAMILVKAAKNANVPLLVGHHRRHNPLIRTARELIDDGKLGQLRAIHANCWMYKPDEYFHEAPWRKANGAGPVSVNLSHDVDLIRYLCGDVVSVQAQSVRSVRGYDNEDVAAAVLRFENGTIGTITVSDMIVSPWSWELTARENPAYPPTAQSCYLIGGTLASLSLPDLTLWENKGPQSWWQPICATTFPRDDSASTVPRDRANPFINQITQFAAVISGHETPLISGEEGFKTLQVIESIQRSAETGEIIFPNAHQSD